jgi:pimeloyl-ACP methyl ester carboxylesterase
MKSINKTIGIFTPLSSPGRLSMSSRSFLLTTVLLVACVSSAFAQNHQQTKQAISVTNYLLYVPKDYAQDANKKWPVMIFLHGSGERGDSLMKVAKHGPPKLVEAGQDFPFIIVSPQCREGGRWVPAQLNDLLTQVIRENRVDTTRIYLTGLSMGGFGTWDWAEQNPERFAAIAPICGGGDPERVWSIRKMPTWVFHGAKDNAVPLQRSEQMVEALKKVGNNVQFTVYPEAGHDSWTETYNNPALYEWLLKQQKQERKVVKVKPKLLDAYVGQYELRPNFTLTVTREGDKLFGQATGQPKVELFPASDTDFFIRQMDVELSFVKDDKGKVDQVVLHQGGDHPAKRIQ